MSIGAAVVAVLAVTAILLFTSDDDRQSTELVTGVARSTVPGDVVVQSGDVQATLIWSGDSDMDVHVVEPNGEETYFSVRESSTGGMLDLDDIPACGVETGTHVENIFWPTGQAPPGRYVAYVHFYNSCGAASQSVQLTVQVNGQIVVDEAILISSYEASPSYTFSAS